VATLSKARTVLDCSNTGIMGSKPMSAFFCVVLACVGWDLVMGLYAAHGILPDYLKGFTLSEVHSDSDQARGPNPWTAQQIMTYSPEQNSVRYLRNITQVTCLAPCIVSVRASSTQWISYIILNCSVHHELASKIWTKYICWKLSIQLEHEGMSLFVQFQLIA
jgi:hypothetical protein